MVVERGTKTSHASSGRENKMREQMQRGELALLSQASPSFTTIKGTAAKSWLVRADKGTDELSLQLPCELVHISAPARQERTRIINIVNTRRFAFDLKSMM